MQKTHSPINTFYQDPNAGNSRFAFSRTVARHKKKQKKNNNNNSNNNNNNNYYYYYYNAAKYL